MTVIPIKQQRYSNSQPCGASHIADEKVCRLDHPVQTESKEHFGAMGREMFPDFKVQVYADKDGGTELWAFSAEGSAMLRFTPQRPGVCVLDVMEVTEPGHHTGTKMFGDMVDVLSKNGYKRIDLTAMKSKNYNGYYTWARLGCVSDSDNQILEKMAGEDGFKGVKRVEQLMGTQEGRDWWKKMGWTTDMRFDLNPNSYSMRVFNAYRKAAGLQNQESKGNVVA